jgi:hypothetical protein
MRLIECYLCRPGSPALILSNLGAFFQVTRRCACVTFATRARVLSVRDAWHGYSLTTFHPKYLDKFPRYDKVKLPLISLL